MLKTVRLQGFRAFRDVAFELGPINVLIGPNGAGKSSLVDFLDLVGATGTQQLQKWVRDHGGSASLLHFGPKFTPECRWELGIETPNGLFTHGAVLTPTHDDRLVLDREWVRRDAPGEAPEVRDIGARSALESALAQSAADKDSLALAIAWQLRRYKVFHVHDTSASSNLRKRSHLSEGMKLRSDGSNLAAVLARLRRDKRRHYERIVSQLRRVVPALDDFDLPDDPDDDAVVNLSWRHRHGPPSYALGPHQLSDGSLRAIALFTLLLMPDDERPRLVVLDEPELGLHPTTMALLASLVRAASATTQFVLATQSAALLDAFDADQILVVESRDGASTLRRPDAREMERQRVELDLSYSDQWDMNLWGGRP